MNGRKKNAPINRVEEYQNTPEDVTGREEKTLMTTGHYCLAGHMKEIGTEMNAQTMETEKEHKNNEAERIKRRNEKLSEAHSTNGKCLHSGQTGLPDTDCNNEENR